MNLLSKLASIGLVIMLGGGVFLVYAVAAHYNESTPPQSFFIGCALVFFGAAALALLLGVCVALDVWRNE